jgi:hypothetical protein
LADQDGDVGREDKEGNEIDEEFDEVGEVEVKCNGISASKSFCCKEGGDGLFEECL